jgi:hypothetical protein
VTLLPPEALDLCHGNALNANFRQGGSHVVEFEGLDDGNDHFHANSLLISPRMQSSSVKCTELLHHSMEPPEFLLYNARTSCAGVLFE